MLSNWVLIVLISFGGRPAVSMQEFSSYENCMKVKTIITTEADEQHLHYKLMCVPR